MGARRPIIVLGPKENLASKLVKEKNIGIVCERKDEVSDFLRREIVSFYKEGKIPKVEAEKIEEFTWESRVKKILSVIENIII
jgi:hypothetical protein